MAWSLHHPSGTFQTIPLYIQLIAILGVGYVISQVRANPLAILGYCDHQSTNAHHVVMVTVQSMLMHDMANAQGWRPAIGAEVVDRKALEHVVEQATVTEIDPPAADD